MKLGREGQLSKNMAPGAAALISAAAGVTCPHPLGSQSVANLSGVFAQFTVLCGGRGMTTTTQGL